MITATHKRHCKYSMLVGGTQAYGLASFTHHLHCFYQSGPAGFPAGVGLAHHVPGAGGPGVLRGYPFHDHLAGHHPFQPAERPADPDPRHRQGHGHQRGHDRRSAVRVFHLHTVLDALPVGHPLRAGCRQRGRSPEQLRCPALQKPPYELAALHVGHRHHGEPHGHGRGADPWNALDGRLPGHCPVPGPAHRGAGGQPAPVEGASHGERHRRNRPAGTELAAGVCPAGRPGSDALFLLLLCSGNHRRAVGQQLSDPEPRSGCRDCRQLCQPVLILASPPDEQPVVSSP